MPRRASGLPRRGAAATDAAAPGMVEAILDGWQPEGVTLPGLLEGVPVGWGGKELHRAVYAAPEFQQGRRVWVSARRRRTRRRGDDTAGLKNLDKLMVMAR